MYQDIASSTQAEDAYIEWAISLWPWSGLEAVAGTNAVTGPGFNQT